MVRSLVCIACRWYPTDALYGASPHSDLTHFYAPLATIHRTSFDKEEKKHWLNCHKGDLVGRYMLQDNKKPAWHSDSKSTPEKICDAVDAMIERINAEEPHTK
jgi:hypothetical protein